jgi:hypothetical protein
MIKYFIIVKEKEIKIFVFSLFYRPKLSPHSNAKIGVKLEFYIA